MVIGEKGCENSQHRGDSRLWQGLPQREADILLNGGRQTREDSGDEAV